MVDGELVINEQQAEVVKDIFDVDVSIREIDGRTVVLNCSA